MYCTPVVVNRLPIVTDSKPISMCSTVTQQLSDPFTPCPAGMTRGTAFHLMSLFEVMKVLTTMLPHSLLP